MWMYFPQEKKQQTSISLKRNDDKWTVEHNYSLHPVRDMFLESKVERTLKPMLQLLKETGQLRTNWREYMKAALFCCPFLTMNLTDSNRFPPEITLLGFASAIEMGADSLGERSLIDQVLDRLEDSLR
jgi:hypothetical protein